MNNKIVVFFVGPLSVILVTCNAIAKIDPISKTWVSDQGNGTYKNPVLYADYSVSASLMYA